MRQRIGLAQALINDPDLVILDEPTSGLDPLGARWMKDLILDLRDQGKTVIMCSHRLEDVQDVCDRIAILSEGDLQAYGEVKTLLQDVNRVEMRASGLQLTDQLRTRPGRGAAASTAASSTPSAIRPRRWKITSCTSSRRARRIPGRRFLPGKDGPSRRADASFDELAGINKLGQSVSRDLKGSALPQRPLQVAAKRSVSFTGTSFMFAVLSLERDPLRLQDLPLGLWPLGPDGRRLRHGRPAGLAGLRLDAAPARRPRRVPALAGPLRPASASSSPLLAYLLRPAAADL